jgi:hypothetical protein
MGIDGSTQPLTTNSGPFNAFPSFDILTMNDTTEVMSNASEIRKMHGEHRNRSIASSFSAPSR